MNFEQLPKKEDQKELVVNSRKQHPELWKLIDEGNVRRKYTDDSAELILLAHEIYEYLHGDSTPEFVYYRESGQEEEKLKKLRGLIEEFFTDPTQRNARKIGDFFW